MEAEIKELCMWRIIDSLKKGRYVGLDEYGIKPDDTIAIIQEMQDRKGYILGAIFIKNDSDDSVIPYINTAQVTALGQLYYENYKHKL